MKTRSILALSVVLLGSCRNDNLGPNTARPPTTTQVTLIDSGYVMRDGVPFHVVFLVREGRAVFEGDIDLGPVDQIARTDVELRSRPQRGVVVSDLGKRWPGGRVPYVFAHPPSQVFADTQFLLDAMLDIQRDVGGVYFAKRNSWDNDYVIFRPTTDNTVCGQSDVGKSGGGQTVLVREPCGIPTVIHELGHALGFWHEQSRCDRDNYVQILTDSIIPGREDQFTKHCLGAQDLESYDEGSIMHYGSHAYGKWINDHYAQTIHSLRGLDYLMGAGTDLSDIDVFTIDRMYQPYGPLIYSIVNQNGSPLLSWGHSGRAISYSVGIVREYNEWNDYEGTHQSWVDYSDGVGATPNLSILDSGHPWTGNSQCVLWSNINGSANYTYWYEISATFANGVVSMVAREAQAPIAAAGPPCWPDQ